MSVSSSGILFRYEDHGPDNQTRGYRTMLIPDGLAKLSRYTPRVNRWPWACGSHSNSLEKREILP
jgi:hypothetical protein